MRDAAPLPPLTVLEAFSHLAALTEHFSPVAAARGVDWPGWIVEQLPHLEQAWTAAELAGHLTRTFRELDPSIEVTLDPPPLMAPPPFTEASFLVHVPYGDPQQGMLLRPPHLITLHLHSPQATVVDVGDLPGVGPAQVAFAGFAPWISVLPGGLFARLSLVVPGPLRPTAVPERSALRPEDTRTRLATIILLWGKLRHLYPYWSELPVDWPQRLRWALARVPQVRSEAAMTTLLEEWLAPLEDAHVVVQPPSARTRPRHALPLWCEDIGGRLLVSNTDGNLPIPLGTQLLALDGEDARARYEALSQRACGNAPVRRYRACTALMTTDGPRRVHLTLRHPDGEEQTLDLTAATPPGAPPSPRDALGGRQRLSRLDPPDRRARQRCDRTAGPGAGAGD